MADILKLTPLSYIVVFGLYIFNLSWGLLEPTIAPYLEIQGASSQTIGTILARRFLVVAFFSIPFALLSSKIGHKFVLFISASATFSAIIVLNTLNGIQAVEYFYILIGVSGAAASGPAAAILAENRGNKRIAAFSLFSTSWMFPPALGAAISTYWFRGTTSDDYTVEKLSSIFSVLMYIIAPFLIIFIILLIWEDRPNSDPTVIKASVKSDLSIINQFKIIFQPLVVLPITLLLFVRFMMGAGAGATIPFLPPYLKSLDASPAQISLLVLILNLAMGIATQFTAPLTKRFGDLQVFAVTTVLSVISLVGIVFSDNLALAAFFYILRGMFANMSAPITQSLVLGFIDEKVRATGSAVAGNIRWFGWVIFSPISGNIIDNYGYEVSFVFTAILYIIAMLMFVGVIHKFPSLEELQKNQKIKDESIISEISDDRVYAGISD